MMEPPDDATIFEPQDLALLGKVFTGAVAIAAGEDSPYAALPVHLLRRRLALAVLAAARRGERDEALLRAEALRMVAEMIETSPRHPPGPPVRPSVG